MMKKNVWILALIVALAVGFVGCGDGGGGGPSGGGLTLWKTITTNDSTFWEYFPNDVVGLKGQIKAAVATEIKAFPAGSEIWLYLTAVPGKTMAGSYGCGAIGGKNFDTGAGGAGPVIHKFQISELALMTAGDAGKIDINIYNQEDGKACAQLSKIEIYKN